MTILTDKWSQAPSKHVRTCFWEDSESTIFRRCPNGQNGYFGVRYESVAVGAARNTCFEAPSSMIVVFELHGKLSGAVAKKRRKRCDVYYTVVLHPTTPAFQIDLILPEDSARLLLHAVRGASCSVQSRRDRARKFLNSKCSD